MWVSPICHPTKDPQKWFKFFSPLSAVFADISLSFVACCPYDLYAPITVRKQIERRCQTTAVPDSLQGHDELQRQLQRQIPSPYQLPARASGEEGVHHGQEPAEVHCVSACCAYCPVTSSVVFLNLLIVCRMALLHALSRQQPGAAAEQLHSQLPYDAVLHLPHLLPLLCCVADPTTCATMQRSMVLSKTCTCPRTSTQGASADAAVTVQDLFPRRTRLSLVPSTDNSTLRSLSLVMVAEGLVLSGPQLLCIAAAASPLLLLSCTQGAQGLGLH